MTKKYQTTKPIPVNEFKAKRIKLGKISLNIFLLVLIIFMGMSYLYYVNQSATGGFDIKGLENDIERLTKQNKQLETEAARLRSLSMIEEAGQELKMVATSYIEYLPAVGGSVATR